MTVTPDQAKMLTSIALAIRPYGAPRWDGVGVMAALKRVAHLKLADVTRAVTRAAEDATLETPAPIGIPSSPCWADKTLDDTPVREPFDRSRFCGICGEPRDRCERKWAGDHEFESVAHSVARHAADDTDVPRVVESLKGHIAHSHPATEPRPHTPNPHAEAAREQLHAAMAGSEDA